MIKIYNYPRIIKRSEKYSANVWSVAHPEDKQVLPVFWSKLGDFVSFEFDEPVMIEVVIHQEKSIDAKQVAVRPSILGIKTEVEDRTITFRVDEARNLKLDPEGFREDGELFIYANKPENPDEIPDFDAENVMYFKAGQAYEVGRLELPSDTILYIEGGAVVRGAIHAGGAENSTVMGRGILDGGYYVRGVDEGIHTVQFEHSRNMTLKDIIILHPMVWTVVLGGCDTVHIDNIRELGYEGSTDGVDICGSRNVLIENCCIKVNDDCIVLKAFDKHDHGERNWSLDVENIHVRNCMLGTYKNGAVMEIGHEFTCDIVNNVKFENIDVVGQHGFGSVFSIQNCDKATITNVTWENIRVEHCYSALINFRIMDSMYSQTKQRGHVDALTLKNIDWTSYIFNIGYTASRIGGCDKDHMIKNVTFDNFKINGKKIESTDELYLFTAHTENIVVK